MVQKRDIQRKRKAIRSMLAIYDLVIKPLIAICSILYIADIHVIKLIVTIMIIFTFIISL